MTLADRLAYLLVGSALVAAGTLGGQWITHRAPGVPGPTGPAGRATVGTLTPPHDPREASLPGSYTPEAGQ